MGNKNFQSDLQVEQQIKEMPDRELMEFTARQVYSVCSTVRSHGQRIERLEGRANKMTGLAGGIGTAIGAALVALFSHLNNR